MDISIDDVSWNTLSELFGNVLTAKQKHLGLSANVKFLNKKKHQPWDSHKSNMGVLHNFQLLGYCSTIVFRQTV